MQARGFTLLELLIVLALISVTAAVVAPRLQRTYEAIAGSGERAEVARQLERLPLLARLQSTGIAIEKGDAAALSALLVIPGGWQVKPLDQVRVEASGLCRTARIRVEGRGLAEEWVLTTPTCEVDDAP